MSSIPRKGVPIERGECNRGRTARVGDRRLDNGRVAVNLFLQFPGDVLEGVLGVALGRNDNNHFIMGHSYLHGTRLGPGGSTTVGSGIAIYPVVRVAYPKVSYKSRSAGPTLATVVARAV